MFGIDEISIEFLTDRPIWVWLSLVVLVGLAVWLYRRTNPPLPGWLRVVLTGLRVVAVVALVLALLEPVLGYTTSTESRRRVVVAVDASASMERVEADKPRRARLDSLLSGPAFARLSDEAEVDVSYFGRSAVARRGDVEAQETALGDALYELDKLYLGQPPDYYLLLSDGRSNSGRAPREVASGLAAPVVGVGVQVDEGAFDIGLARTDFNPVVFVGRPTEIEVKLTWRNAAGRRTRVELRQGDRVLAEQSLNLDVETGFGDVALRWVPESPGQKMLQAGVVPLEGEETEENNRRTMSVKVLKSRLLTAVVTEHPDYETGFLKRFLERSDKYEVELLATGADLGNLTRRFPSAQTELNRYDLVILQDPDPRTLVSHQGIIESYLAEKGGAVWVLMGEAFASAGRVDWFDRLLPFHPSGARAYQRVEFQAEPDEANLFHPAVRLGDSRASIRSIWSELPPFQSLVVCDRVDPRAVVLASAPERVSPRAVLPVMGFKRHGPGKLLASAALPFWPWGFLRLGYGEDDGSYARFVDGAVGWLTVKDDFDPVRVVPEKEVFTRGEIVRFDGFAYDPGFRPIPGVSGTVEMSRTDGEESYTSDLLALGEGRYYAEIPSVAPAEYDYRAVLEKDGVLLKENRGQVLVEAFSLEEFDRSADPATLAAVASLSGGSYFSYQDFDAAVGSMDLSPRLLQEHGEVGLWNRFWVLLAFVGALAAEWLLRKINQLV